MARRRRKSVLDSLLELTSVLPWWVGVGLAVVSYLLLHAHAASASAATGYASVFRGLAIAGQYIVPAICLFGAASSAISRHRRRRLFDAGSAGLAGMSWQEFEMLVGEAYRRRGFSVTEVGGGGKDGGVDLELRKGNETFLVQCKHWRAFRVGVDKVRELYGVMAARRASGGMVVTGGDFTPDAVEFARGLNIELVDGGKLSSMLGDVKTPAASGQPPTCPGCGNSMVRRVAQRGANAGKPFWGCSSYPACRRTLPIG